jgi:hypothetical protein
MITHSHDDSIVMIHKHRQDDVTKRDDAPVTTALTFDDRMILCDALWVIMLAAHDTVDLDQALTSGNAVDLGVGVTSRGDDLG